MRALLSPVAAGGRGDFSVIIEWVMKPGHLEKFERASRNTWTRGDCVSVYKRDKSAARRNSVAITSRSSVGKRRYR